MIEALREMCRSCKERKRTAQGLCALAMHMRNEASVRKKAEKHVQTKKNAGFLGRRLFLKQVIAWFICLRACKLPYQLGHKLHCRPL